MAPDRSVNNGTNAAAPSSAHFSTSQSARPPLRGRISGQGLGFRVQGLGFRTYNFGFRV
jgi:hypothetical protein